MKRSRYIALAACFWVALLPSCTDTSRTADAEGAERKLVGDPLAAIRAVAPENWIVEPLKEKAHPPQLMPGEGKSIRFFHRDQEYAPWYSGVYVYIMPREYSSARNKELVLSVDEPGPASLLYTTKNAKVYISHLSHRGWPNMKDDIIDALTTGGPYFPEDRSMGRQSSKNDQKDFTVPGKYGAKNIVELPMDKREYSSQNVTREMEMAVRSDAARAKYNMREIHQAWLRDASNVFVCLSSTLPPEILDDPFNLEGGLECFIASDPRFVVLTSIGPDGERDIFEEE